jgi:hypothetical protein
MLSPANFNGRLPWVRQQPGVLADVQRRFDLWKAMNSLEQRKRIERARPIRAAA